MFSIVVFDWGMFSQRLSNLCPTQYGKLHRFRHKNMMKARFHWGYTVGGVDFNILIRKKYFTNGADRYLVSVFARTLSLFCLCGKSIDQHLGSTWLDEIVTRALTTKQFAIYCYSRSWFGVRLLGIQAYHFFIATLSKPQHGRALQKIKELITSASAYSW